MKVCEHDQEQDWASFENIYACCESGDTGDSDIHHLKNSAITFTHCQWQALTPSRRQEALVNHSVHLVGKPTVRVLGDVKDWDATEVLGTVFDLEDDRAVHGESMEYTIMSIADRSLCSQSFHFPIQERDASNAASINFAIPHAATGYKPA